MDKLTLPALLEKNAFSQLKLTELWSVNETESEAMRDIEGYESQTVPHKVFSLR